ncbi:MAG: hypothetical protein IJQ68_01250 [Methanobrevibacter sp.]|uniref:hypothetical protein n=1 Tax=Methanobrevibacter sp. TaxID=66852 RepID=UPI0025E13F11|nr:hypothetical protein [Methanobrevibacter sp.]MBR0270612.1 hypothetical protein [Methanobrevibacter sp.]
MISNEKQTVTQLTQYIASLFKENDITVQKIIYQIKMDLGTNHPLYDKLPYYWYYCGPYCELITE